jgi:hypothetical protein
MHPVDHFSRYATVVTRERGVAKRGEALLLIGANERKGTKQYTGQNQGTSLPSKKDHADTNQQHNEPVRETSV